MPQQHAIYSFPTETLCEIFKYLDWRGLLSVKLTCHAWKSTLNSRQFWYNQITSLICEPGDTPLEEPVADYTISELESQVIRSLRAKECWRTDDSSIVTTTHVIQESLPGWAEKLIAGGRWFLSLDWEGVLFYYDLDNPGIRKRTLIDPVQHKTKDPDRMREMHIWIDPSKEKLSFRLALSGHMLTGDYSRYRIYIYQVDLVGHGKAATLQAELIKIWHAQRDFDLSHESLAVITKDHLVECWTIEMDEGEGDNIEGFYLSRYMIASGGECPENRISIQFKISNPIQSQTYNEICMGPGDKIIRIGVLCTEIYTIQQVESYNPEGGALLLPIHQLFFDSAAPIICKSEVFAFQDWMWRLVVYREELFLTRIGDDNEPWETFTFGEHTSLEAGVPNVLGPSSGVFVHKNGLVDIVKYSWDSKLKCKIIQSRRIHSRLLTSEKQPSVLGVDESKGRIVFFPKKDSTILVMDLMTK